MHQVQQQAHLCLAPGHALGRGAQRWEVCRAQRGELARVRRRRTPSVRALYPVGHGAPRRVARAPLGLAQGGSGACRRLCTTTSTSQQPLCLELSSVAAAGSCCLPILCACPACSRAPATKRPAPWCATAGLSRHFRRSSRACSEAGRPDLRRRLRGRARNCGRRGANGLPACERAAELLRLVAPQLKRKLAALLRDVAVPDDRLVLAAARQQSRVSSASCVLHPIWRSLARP